MTTYRVTMNGTTVASGLTAGQLMASDWQDEPNAQIDEEITTEDTTAIESLRQFAEQHGEIQFAHLCTAALQGEEWAIESIVCVLDHISDAENTQSGRCESCERTKLEIVRSTDTTRPDGAIARTAVEV